METAIHDLRLAFRSLRSSPGFTLLAVLTLGLGIGANTAIFSVVKAALLRPLPYAEPGGVVSLWSRWKDFPKTWVSGPEVETYRREVHALGEIGLYDPRDLALTGGDQPERLAAAAVTANVFGVLGVKPLLGRALTPAEEVEGRDRVVVIGQALWRRRFAADPRVLGRTVQVDGLPYTVVGVMPGGFRLPHDYLDGHASQAWVPLVLDPDERQAVLPSNGGSHSYFAVARLRPGATAAQADAELAALDRRLTTSGIYPVDWHFQAHATPVAEEVSGRVRPALLVLLGAVALVLLTACANVASLLLVRGERRRHEMAVRRALGAGTGRMVRALLAESLVLAALGGAAGVALAGAAAGVAARTLPANLPRVADARVDGGVLAFAVLVSAVTAVAFGVLPALAATRVGPADAMREGGRTSTGSARRERVRGAVVVAEIALAVVLTAAAGLMVRSVRDLLRVDLGFSPRSVLTLELDAPSARYPTPQAVSGFYDELLRRVRALPAVDAAGAIRRLPLATEIGDRGLTVEGYAPPPGQNAKADWQVVTPGAMEALGIRLVRGRTFTESDGPDAAPVVVINERLARTYFGGAEPLGRRIRIGVGRPGPWTTVVGVVRDLRHNDVREPAKEQIFALQAQASRLIGYAPGTMRLVIRSAADPRALVRPVEAQIRALDPGIPAAQVRTLEEVVSDAVAQPRLTMVLLLAFGALALALAAVGIYGVIAYAVESRTAEIGIRSALGARPRRLVWETLRRGVAQAGVGLAAGAVLALGAFRALSHVLAGVSGADLLPLAAAGVATVLVALLASYVPARRAARVDPMTTLRRG
jgi:putative ABC transport system permease protein